MKLSYYCASTSCGKINYINVKSDNRYDLKQEIGEEFNERCKHCGKHTKKHINRLFGEINSKVIIGFVLFSALLTFVTWNFGFIVGKLSLGIPVLAWLDQKRRATNFNKLMID